MWEGMHGIFNDGDRKGRGDWVWNEMWDGDINGMVMGEKVVIMWSDVFWG